MTAHDPQAALCTCGNAFGIRHEESCALIQSRGTHGFEADDRPELFEDRMHLVGTRPTSPTPREAELMANNLDILTRISKAVYPGSSRHPAFDSSWLLTELEQMIENGREASSREARLVEALREAEKVLALCHTRDFEAPEDAEVLAIGRRIGFGALISAASKCWKDEAVRNGWPDGGQHTAGPCEITVRQTLAFLRAALEDK